MRKELLTLTLTLVASSVAADDRAAIDLPRGLWAGHARLVWWDPGRQLPLAFDEMSREASGILRSFGIELEWRTSELQATTGEGEIQVILLPDDPARRLHRRDTMGRVERAERTALWIFAARVRRTLGLGAGSMLRVSIEERREYPRALGRVVAHELVHVLLPGEPHGTRGLMQAELTRGFLTAPRVEIDERIAQAVMRPIRGPVLASAR